MKILSVSTFNNRPNYLTKSKNSTTQNALRETSSQNAYAPYYLPIFKANETSKKHLQLDLYDEELKPNLFVEYWVADSFDSKPGVALLSSIALKNKIQSLQNNEKLSNMDFYVTSDSKLVTIDFEEENLPEAIEQVRERIQNPKLTQEELDKAKKLSKMTYELYLNNSCMEYDFSDISKNTSLEDFSKLIDDITLEDVEKYNEKYVNNSEAKISLVMNRNSYNNKKQEIMPLLESF